MSATITLPAGIVKPAARLSERWERALARREIFCLDAPRALSLCCVDGVLWITVDGDTNDHVLTPGQAMRLADGSHATIQAMQAARLGVGRS